MSKMKTLAHYLDLLSTKEKYAYIGWLGHANLGDEILYDAHCKLFPKNNLKFYFRSKLLDRFLRRAHSYKSAFLGGGTLINQDSIWLKHLSELKQMNVPTFCFGTGVACTEFWEHEPDWKWNNQSNAWAEHLRNFKYVGVRGPRSKAYLDSMGIQCEIIGDTALALAPREVSYRAPGDRVKVGVNVGYAKGKMWGSEEFFLQQAEEFVKLLIDQGYEVVLLPVWDRDMEINEGIYERVSSNNIRLVTAYDDYNAYSKEVAKCDLFVGEKLHATIIATMHRIPSLMLEYRPKCLDYMSSIDMEEYTLRTSEFDPQRALSLLQKLQGKHNEVFNELDVNILKYTDLQFKRAEIISNELWFK